MKHSSKPTHYILPDGTRISARSRRLLLLLAKKAKEIPPEHFDMNSFYNSHMQTMLYEDVVKQRTITRKALSACRTTACMLGWATTMPEFQKLGLKGIYNKVDDDIDITFQGKLVGGFEAAARALGIPFALAQGLFGGSLIAFGGESGEAHTPSEWSAIVLSALAKAEQVGKPRKR